MSWQGMSQEALNDLREEIRADERERCRAELRAKVEEIERIARDDYGSALDELYDFAKEAFGDD